VREGGAVAEGAVKPWHLCRSRVLANRPQPMESKGTKSPSQAAGGQELCSPGPSTKRCSVEAAEEKARPVKDPKWQVEAGERPLPQREAAHQRLEVHVRVSEDARACLVFLPLKLDCLATAANGAVRDDRKVQILFVPERIAQPERHRSACQPTAKDGNFEAPACPEGPRARHPPITAQQPPPGFGEALPADRECNGAKRRCYCRACWQPAWLGT